MRASKDGGAGRQQCGAPEPQTKPSAAAGGGSVREHIHLRQQTGPQLCSPGITRRNESAVRAPCALEHLRACCLGSWS